MQPSAKIYDDGMNIFKASSHLNLNCNIRNSLKKSLILECCKNFNFHLFAKRNKS